MADSNAPEHKARGLLGMLGKKEAKPDQHLQQQSDSVDPHTNDAPAYNGQAHDAPPPAVSRQPQHYDQGAGRNTYAGEFGMFGKEVVKPSPTVDSQTTLAPAYTGDGLYKDVGQGAGGNTYAGEFGMFGKEVAKPDPFVQQQSHTVVPHATRGHNTHTPAVSHQPQHYGHGDGGNTGAGDLGMIGKKKAKPDHHVQHKPVYTGDGHHSPPPAVSHQPQHYGQGAGRNTGAGDLGMFGKEKTKPDQDMKKDVKQQSSSGESHARDAPACTQPPSVYNQPKQFGGKEKDKPDEHVQQKSDTVDPRATHDPANTGDGHHSPPLAVSDQPQHCGEGAGRNTGAGIFGMFGKEKTKPDQHLQKQPHTVDPHGSDAPANTQSPSVYHQPKEFGGKKEDKADEHVQQKSHTVDPYGTTGDGHHSPPPAVSHQPQHYGQGTDRNTGAGDLGMFGKEKTKPDQDTRKDVKQQFPSGDSHARDAPAYNQPSSVYHQPKQLGGKEEKKPNEHVQQKTHTVDPRATHEPANTGDGRHSPPLVVSDQPQHYGHGEDRNTGAGIFGMFGKEKAKPDQHLQQKSHTVDPHASDASGYTPAPAAVSDQPQQYGQGAKKNTDSWDLGMFGKEKAKPDHDVKKSPNWNPLGSDAPACTQPPSVYHQPKQFGGKEEEKADEHVQQKFDTVDPHACQTPAYTQPPALYHQPQQFGAKEEEKADQNMRQQSDTLNPHTNDSPDYNGEGRDAPPTAVSRQPKPFGQAAGRNSDAGDFGMFGGKKEEKTSDAPAYTQPPAVSHQPQHYGERAGGNTDAAELGTFLKEKAKPDQHVQQQSDTLDPLSSHAPSYNGEGDCGTPTAASHQPQHYGQGMSGNASRQPHRYGQGEGGNKQHEDNAATTSPSLRARMTKAAESREEIAANERQNNKKFPGHEGDKEIKEEPRRWA